MDFYTHLMVVVFWTATGLLFYITLGYPFLLWILVLLRGEQTCAAKDGTIARTVTVVIVAHNEAEHISARIANLTQSADVGNNIEIIIVNDASTDNTVDGVRAIAAKDKRVRLIALTQRGGKAAGINAGVAAAHGEIIVFTDARQQFAPDAIARLMNHFTDRQVGAVSGALELAPAGDHAGSGLTTYWGWEKKIRHWESRLHSAIGCTGAIYAVRRDLLDTPVLPDHTILDDVVIPMRLAMKGYRVLFDPLIQAYDPKPSDSKRERQRKARTLAGNFQMLGRYPVWLLPWRNRLWWQLISHKYLRLLTPFLLAMMLYASFKLLALNCYMVLFLGQVMLYLLGIIGWLSPKKPNFWIRLPAAILFFGLLPLAGLWFYLTPRRHAGW